MKPPRLIAGLLLLALGMTTAALAADAPSPATPDSATPADAPQSPVAVFRQLLAMAPDQLEIALAPYSPDRRQRIQDKIEEYQMLPPEFRELRLRVTELRWYLLPFLTGSLTNADAGLQQVPEPYRELVRARVEEWKLLPPDLKSSILEYQGMLDHFVARDSAGKMVIQSWPPPGASPDPERKALEQKLDRWQALSDNERQQVYGSFEHYFSLNDTEKQAALDALPSLERAQAEKVLDPIETWPRQDQEKYFAAFSQFAQMSAADRARFLKNARRWHQMSTAERQAWRDLLHQLADQPPMPPDFTPPENAGGSSFVAPAKTNPAADRLK